MVIAVPDSNGRLFFGDADSEQSFGTAIALLRNMGAKIEEIDIFPLLETARLLYEGPWVAERYAAVGAFIEKNPGQGASGHPRNHHGRGEDRPPPRPSAPSTG